MSLSQFGQCFFVDGLTGDGERHAERPAEIGKEEFDANPLVNVENVAAVVAAAVATLEFTID